jgi:hypothetical protein
MLFAFTIYFTVAFGVRLLLAQVSYPGGAL